jgi:predicted HTH domain antitoxin
MWAKGILLRILVCIGACVGFLYSYIDKQNAVTRRRLEIPVLAKEIKDLKEENTRLKYEIELFESPEHLMELARYSEYSHLKHPMFKVIVTMRHGLALQVSSSDKEEKPAAGPKLKFAIGAKQ